jgi:uncharacterized protein Yka (UPF0111/DUF47 family)
MKDMNAIDIRKELHDYIETADVSILNAIYEILRASKGQDDYEISGELKRMLDERLKAYYSNPTDVLTLEEMKAKYKK